MRGLFRTPWLPLVVALLGACGEKSASPTDTPDASGAPDGMRLSREKLLDPATCGRCHPKHYEEWRGSMHAYSSVDPVFVAMNKRGQRETDGALGDFCVKCHAPMALREGLTTDGLNLEELPKSVQGVTCYFCHNATAYGEDHSNANLTLANDDVMRGSFADAADPKVHGTAASKLHQRGAMESSLMCGTCHDVVNDHGLHIERTLKEYKESVFSIEKYGKESGSSCQGCHMPSFETEAVAKVPNMELKKRPRSQHVWPAVDVALTDFPNSASQRRETECELAANTWIASIDHNGNGQFTMLIETDAGHHQPSGTSQDRRMWLEFVAYDEQDNVIYEIGRPSEGELVDPAADPNLCMFRDHLEDDTGHEVHMFWEATRKNEALSRTILPNTGFGGSHGYRCSIQIPRRRVPARVEMRMHMRPIAFEVLQSLVDSGDLERAVMEKMPTFTLHRTHVAWKYEDGDSIAVPDPVPEAEAALDDCLFNR